MNKFCATFMINMKAEILGNGGEGIYHRAENTELASNAQVDPIGIDHPPCY